MTKTNDPIMSRLASVFGAITLIAMTQTTARGSGVIGRWNLGEQDIPAPVIGQATDPTTVDLIAGANLTLQAGSPVYSSDVPAGGSTVSIQFGGPDVGDWYSGIVPAITNMDQNNFTLDFDAEPTASPNGYSTAVGIGRYGNSEAFFFVDAGGNWNYYISSVGVQISGPGPGFGVWQHVQFRRVAGVNALYVNGVQVGTQNNTLFGVGVVTPELSIGAPKNGGGFSDSGGCFVGNIDNVVLTDLSIDTPPTITGAPTISPGKIYAGNSIILQASVSGDHNGLTYLWLTNGVLALNAGTTNPVFINGVTTNNSGNYSLVVTNVYGAATSSVVAVTVLPSGGADVMKFHLGEDDPGAVSGGPGDDQTVDAILGNNLTAFGEPYYTNNVPTDGGSLSMGFDGASYYRSTNLTGFFAGLDQANFSLSFDVNCTALGGGGFSFPLTIGKNGGVATMMGIVEIGGVWEFFRAGVGGNVLGPVQLGTWTHFQIERRNFDTQTGIRVFMNGQDANFEDTTYGVTAPIMTVGANTVGDGVNVEGNFTGMIDNVVIHNYSIGGLPVITSGPTASPDTTLLTGETLTLSATITGGTPANYLWRRNGTVLTNDLEGTTSTVAFPNAPAGNYDLIVSNSPAGVITSSIVVISVITGSESPVNATYNLGEQDPGAVAGNPGDTITIQADGVKNLTAFGAPFYSSNVPPGGSALSMAFGGADYYAGGFPLGSGRWAVFYTNGFDLNNCSLSCDVYPTNLGTAGFSFPVSMGNNLGGEAIVEVGGSWYVIHQGVLNSVPGPAVVLNAWTHLELRRQDYGSGYETHLFVDGVDAGIANTSQPRAIQPYFTIGANFRGPADPTLFEGYFRGLVDNVKISALAGVTPTLTLVSVGASVVIDCAGGASAHYRLLRSTNLGTGSWTTIGGGEADSTGFIEFTDSNPPAGGAFYRAVSP